MLKISVAVVAVVGGIVLLFAALSARGGEDCAHSAATNVYVENQKILFGYYTSEEEAELRRDYCELEEYR